MPVEIIEQLLPLNISNDIDESTNICGKMFPYQSDNMSPR